MKRSKEYGVKRYSACNACRYFCKSGWKTNSWPLSHCWRHGCWWKPARFLSANWWVSESATLHSIGRYHWASWSYCLWLRPSIRISNTITCLPLRPSVRLHRIANPSLSAWHSCFAIHHHHIAACLVALFWQTVELFTIHPSRISDGRHPQSRIVPREQQSSRARRRGRPKQACCPI